jgi:hypothetical protein
MIFSGALDKNSDNHKLKVIEGEMTKNQKLNFCEVTKIKQLN